MVLLDHLGFELRAVPKSEAVVKRLRYAVPTTAQTPEVKFLMESAQPAELGRYVWLRSKKLVARQPLPARMRLFPVDPAFHEFVVWVSGMTRLVGPAVAEFQTR
jgi:hypothetical protein